MTYMKTQQDMLQTEIQLHGDAVYRLALSQTGSSADAEDVYQDVFLRLFRHEGGFSDEEHVKAWLLRVTINRCRDLHRSSWMRKKVAIDPDELELEDEGAFNQDLWNMVAALPTVLREVVHLYYVEGYRTEEIARIVECRPGTVRSRLARAREKLRAAISADRTDENCKKEVSYVSRQKNEGLRIDAQFSACAEAPAGRCDPACSDI